MYKKLCFIKAYLLNVSFLVLYLFSMAQTFNPEIENYSIEDYGADNQNWGIDIDNNGIVYAANNRGLLKYNGEIWQLFELPNRTIIRSVLIVNDTIYTGSYEEFGYWKKDDLGNLSYTSLNNLFGEDYEFKSDEFWQIVKHGNDIIFRSFGGVYIYNGNNIISVPNSQEVSNFTTYDNRLIVGNLKNGLQELINGKLVPFVLSSKNYNFDNIANIVSNNEKKLFFFDTNKGGYIYNSNQLLRLPKKINTLLDNYILNKTVFLDVYRIAFGTVKNGIIIYNLKSQGIQYISKESGLYNNTILGLEFHKGNLWCALDNGISRINFDSPYLYYKDHTGALGTVYDVAFFNDKYYLASNTGIYSFTDDNKLNFVQGSEGHVWDLTVLENQLFCGHNDGTFYIENDSLHRVGSSTEGVFGYFNIPNKKQWFLQGAYNGVNFLKKVNNKWISKEIKNIDFPINNIVFESEYVIWATHPYKGLYQIKFKEDYTETSQIVYYGNDKNFNQYKTIIYNLNGSVVFYNSKKWLQYFKNKDSIGLYKDFQQFNAKSLIFKEHNGSWFIDDNEAGVITYYYNKFKKTLEVDALEIRKRSVSKYEKIEIKDDSLRILNLNDGFAIFNINKLKMKEASITNSPIIDKIYSNRKQFSVNDSLLRFPYKDAQYLSFEVYTPNQYGNDHVYSLSGEINQRELIRNGKFTLQNLAYGNYTLSIKNKGMKTELKYVKDFHFKVLPPWYLSIVMRIVYFLSFLGILYLIYKINKTRIRRQQLALNKIHIRKTQEKIYQLEKENLEKEVKTKQRELLNTTDSIIRKNETIMVMYNELKRLTEASTNTSRTKKILEISKKDIKGTNDWKVFESNFNELNRDFFKKLIAIHPKLTSKDLRLCAYIKTGLPSKKIAFLMGISLRGVELHRYRLRKKLNINSMDNFFHFLREL